MKSKYLPLLIITTSAILIAINFIFISEDMGSGWVFYQVY